MASDLCCLSKISEWEPLDCIIVQAVVRFGVCLRILLRILQTAGKGGRPAVVPRPLNGATSRGRIVVRSGTERVTKGDSLEFG